VSIENSVHFESLQKKGPSIIAQMVRLFVVLSYKRKRSEKKFTTYSVKLGTVYWVLI